MANPNGNPTLTDKQRAYILKYYRPRGRGKHNSKAIAAKLGICRNSVYRVIRGTYENILIQGRKPKMSSELFHTIETSEKTFKPLSEMLKRPCADECDFTCPVCGMGVDRKGEAFRDEWEARGCCLSVSASI